MSDTLTATTGDNNPPKYSLKELIKKAGEFGRAAARGEAALPSLALEVASAAAYNELAINEKGTNGDDDISAIYDAYLKARPAHKQKEVKSRTQQVSKLRSIARPSRCKGDWVDENGDLVECYFATVLAAADKMWLDAFPSGAVSKPRYEFLVAVAKAQEDMIPPNHSLVEPVELLTIDKLEELLRPAEKEEKTVAEKVKRMLDNAIKLRDGKKDKDGNVVEPGLGIPEMEDTVNALTNLWWVVDPEAAQAAAEKEKKEAEAKYTAELLGFRLVKAGRKVAGH